MKTNRTTMIPRLHLPLLATVALAANAGASTVISNYSNPGPDGTEFLYLDKVIMSSTDSWSDADTVGSWSFRDLRVGRNPNKGWGHAATWFLVELTESAQVTVSSLGGVSTAWAGFTIYAGESVNDDPDVAHQYSNNGLEIAALNGGWDKNGPGGTTGLTYVGHAHEGTQTTSASGTWTLGPGLYTIAFGNADDSSNVYQDLPYSFSITTTPVPEPSAALLSILAVGAAALRRRRA